MNPVTYPKEIRGRWYLAANKSRRPVTEVCQLFGIARKTYYKWYRHDHRKTSNSYVRPKRQPNTKLTPGVCRIIDQEKKFTNYGPLKMKLLLRRRLGITVSTTIIYRYYRRKKLIRKPQKKLPWYRPMKEHLIPHQPGEVLQMDAKYVWQGGKRKYQRTFIDVYTGFQHAVIMDSLEAQDTVSALEEAERVFPFPIFGIQNDNGSENRGEFHQYLGKRGIAHYFIPKSSPNWDGAVERAHGVIDQEFYVNPLRPWQTLTEYLHWYNYERIHLGKYLNGLIPIEKFQAYQKKVLPLTVN
jgi:transposase InsO family protein